MRDFCIVGTGISGSTIANLLKKKYSIQVIDKARGLGGRSSNKRYKKLLSFDHGLQFISPKTKEFKKFILNLESKKVVKNWKGLHIDLLNNKDDYKLRYIGKNGNNDISKYMLKKTKVLLTNEVLSISFNSGFWTLLLNNKKKIFSKNLVLTCPFPQIKNLAKKYLNNKMKNLRIKMQPNITLMCAFKSPKKINVSSIKFKDSIISWASNENSKKRFNSNLSLWTIQCNLNWSKKNINFYKKQKKLLIRKIIKNFSNLTGYDINHIEFAKIHGWKYAYNFKKSNIKSYWSKKNNLGICGDWFLGSKAENSWQSAVNLYNKI
jgi:renalase